MTEDQFDAAYRAFCQRRPFRAFLIEFASGTQLLIGHPEAVRNEAQLYVTRCPMVLTCCSRPTTSLDSSIRRRRNNGTLGEQRWPH